MVVVILNIGGKGFGKTGIGEQQSRADLTPFPFRAVRLSQKTTSSSLCNQLFTYLWTNFPKSK
jgi:hypothetical protein